MIKSSIIGNTGLSKEACELIESGLAPIFIGVDTELYDLHFLVETIDAGKWVFSEQDTKIIKDCSVDSAYIELNTGGHRNFKKILGF